jgi:hypothetical protein
MYNCFFYAFLAETTTIGYEVSATCSLILTRTQLVFMWISPKITMGIRSIHWLILMFQLEGVDPAGKILRYPHGKSPSSHKIWLNQLGKQLSSTPFGDDSPNPMPIIPVTSRRDVTRSF